MKLATEVLPVLEVIQVQPVPWVDKDDKVQTVHQVFQARTELQVPQALEVDQVTMDDQVFKDEPVSLAQLVLQVRLVQPVQRVVTTECTVPFTLDTVKRRTFLLALLDTPSSGLVTLFSTLLVTADLLPRISALLALACEVLPLCHSCTATLTNNVTLPLEMTSLTGCRLLSQ